MPDNSDMEEELSEIKKWVRIQGLESLSRVLDDFSDRDLVLYNQADGETTTTELGDEVDLHRTRISEIMGEWNKLGIVEKEGQQWKHLAPLSALGMNEPEFNPDSD